MKLDKKFKFKQLHLHRSHLLILCIFILFLHGSVLHAQWFTPPWAAYLNPISSGIYDSFFSLTPLTVFQQAPTWPALNTFIPWEAYFYPIDTSLFIPYTPFYIPYRSPFRPTALNSINKPWLISPSEGISIALLSSPQRQVVGIETGQIVSRFPEVRVAKSNYLRNVPSYVPNQIIVQFIPGTPPAEINRVCSKYKFRELYTSPFAGYTLLETLPLTSISQSAQTLMMERSILFAEPNYYRFAHFLPNDGYYKYQWHLQHLDCDLAWDYGTGAGVEVALLDSGVAYETSGIYAQAPDLSGTLFVPGYDFVNDDALAYDDYRHGTHMAGCIAQTTNNLIGTAGVAFDASIIPVKIMDSIGGVTIADEVDGIYFASNNGAQIISMSLGGLGISDTEAAAITYAYNNGTTIICSAGNSGSNAPEYPASYPEPVSVSSVRYDFTFSSSYSNYGIYIDVCAPGGDLSVDQNADGFGDGILQQTHDGNNFSTFSYHFFEGTSPAAALVSGVAALIISKNAVPLTPADVISILTGSALDLGTSGWDQYYGYGLVNAYSALLQTP